MQNQRDSFRDKILAIDLSGSTLPYGALLQAVESLDKVPEQIKSFLMFRKYFAVRTILFETGGIQSESTLSGDPTFSQIGSNYDIVQKVVYRI